MGIEDSSQLPWTTKGKYYLVLLYYIAKRTLSKFFICSLSELKSSLVMDQVLPGVLIISCATKKSSEKCVFRAKKMKKRLTIFLWHLKNRKPDFGYSCDPSVDIVPAWAATDNWLIQWWGFILYDRTWFVSLPQNNAKILFCFFVLLSNALWKKK